MPKLVVTDRAGGRHEVDAPAGKRLMVVLRDRAGLPVEGLCGGCASCGTCHVHIDAAWRDRLPPPQQAELDMLSLLEHYKPGTSRLSCQIAASDAPEGLALTLAPEE
jgi:2Fe-2S ferredoxin